MAHIHSVYDSEQHFLINPTTRAITNQEPQKTTLIQYAHNSKRFTFELPRYIDGHDMSTCNKVEIHYLNIETKTGEQNAGVYIVDDLQVFPEDEDVVALSWLISQNATQLIGTLNFLVSFKCVTDGNIDYAWNTAICSSIAISTGIYNSEIIVEQYADVLEQWKKDLQNLVTDEKINKLVTDYLERNPVEVPKALPNPHALTLTGAVEAKYDGSQPLSVEIPDGLDNLRIIRTITIEDGVTGYDISTDENNLPFSLTELILYSSSLSGGRNYHGVALNGNNAGGGDSFKVWHGTTAATYQHRITALGGGAAMSLAITKNDVIKQSYFLANGAKGKDKIESINIWFAGGCTAGETITIYGR